MLTIEDLGVLRSVELDDDGAVRVQLTPTYSGCPALEAMRDDVLLALTHAGYADVRVDLVLAPAWTTDWMSDAGKEKLRRYGIQAPTGRAAVRGSGPVRLQLAVKCPRCDSLNTRELARFGSTSQGALRVPRLPRALRLLQGALMAARNLGSTTARQRSPHPRMPRSHPPSAR